MARHDTWMPLYVGDYLADTLHLTTRQHGAYLLLLMHAWRNGGNIPTTEAAQAAVARMPVKEWAKDAEIVLEFFDFDTAGKDGIWHQRVRDELAVAEAMTQQRSKAGKASAAKRERERQQNRNEISTPVERPMDSRTKPSQSPSPDDSEANASGADAPKFDPVKAMFDDGVRLLTDTGTSESNARSQIGKWRKTHGDEATRDSIQAAFDHGITKPIEWINARLGKPKPTHETWDQLRIREGMEMLRQ